MIVLINTTDKVQAVLAGSVTANQLQCTAYYRDITSSAFDASRTLVDTNNTTDVDLVPAPASSTQRVVDFMSIYNRDTATATLTVKYDANGTEYILWKGDLSAGERLEYSDKSGFNVYDNRGALKTLNISGTLLTNQINRLVLASDVVNNNATANTLADLTGLTFNTVAGETYWFRFFGAYTSAASTTGSRWTINGSGLTDVYYYSRYTLTGTTDTSNYVTAIQLPASANGTSVVAGNIAFVEGTVKASSDGSVQMQFASEISSSAITAKAGAILDYQRVL